MVKDIMMIMTECVKHPRRTSIWLPEQEKYICPESEDARKYFEGLIDEQKKHVTKDLMPPLHQHFKLIFLTAAGGTLLFVVLCIVLTFAAGKEPPPLFEKVIVSLFDLAKIGFGTVAGLLVAPRLQKQELRSNAST